MTHIQNFSTKLCNGNRGTSNSLNIQLLVPGDGCGACSFAMYWRKMITSWHGHTFYVTGTLSCEWITSQRISDADLFVVTWTSCWTTRREANDLRRHDVANETPRSWNDHDNEGLHEASWDNSQRNLSCTYFTMEVNVHLVKPPFTLNRGSVKLGLTSLITRFMGPTWGPSGADRTQVGPMLAPWVCYLGSSVK